MKDSSSRTGAAATMTVLAAAATIVLAILGLVGVLPESMTAIATIVLGATLLFEAGAVGARHGRHEDPLAGGSLGVRASPRGGLSAETLGGLAGIALGILAVIGFAPLTLSTVALIVFGVALLMGNETKGRGEALIGIGAAVLGIVALLGLHNAPAPVTLILIGFLALGSVLLLSGSTHGARALAISRHHAAHHA